MIIEHTAFIIPTHPPKYNFVYGFINTLREYDICIDVYIVFSNDEDFRLFSLKEYIKPIIAVGALNTNSIITFKKFYGLKHLMNTAYDYFIVCDSEVTILSDYFTADTIKSKLDSIYSNKHIYACDITDIQHSDTKLYISTISKMCARLYSDEEYTQLQTMTNNFNLYFWWSDIPVYKRTHLKDFFNKIDYSNIEHRHFDHIIYQYFLVLTEGFKLINTTPIHSKWSFELLDTTDIHILTKLSELGYGFGWVPKKLYDPSNIEFLNTQNTLLIYHLDR